MTPRQARRIAARIAAEYGGNDSFKVEIAKQVHAFRIPHEKHYGRCLIYCVVGKMVLKQHGIEAMPQLGTMSYCFDGDGSVLKYGVGNPLKVSRINGIVISGHFWLTTGNDVIDFSPRDWPPLMPPHALPPPPFIWCDRAAFIPANKRPSLGRVAYGFERDESARDYDEAAEFERAKADLYRLNPALVPPG